LRGAPEVETFNPGSSRNLDILRAMAVALVVQDHLFGYFGNPRYFQVIQPALLGRFGVTLFFVHTALVLMASMDRQWTRSGRHRFLEIFFIRRGFRIFPLSVFVLLLYVVFDLPGNIGTAVTEQPAVTMPRFVANLFLAQNIGSGISLIATMWSLAYEWQMYLMLPLFYWMFRKSKTSVGVLAVWGALALLALTYYTRLGHFNKAHAFWKIPDWEVWGPCFLAGVWAFFTARHVRPRPPLPAIALPLGIATLFLPMMETHDQREYIPAALMVGLLIPYCREIKRGWVSETARVVVRYSYGIYLFHLFALWLAFVKLGGQSRSVQWVVFWAALAGASVAGYHLLEHPMIRACNWIAAWLERLGRPHSSS
jgi:peptidoglycan/LPS O-acetylase OafA/YrhL